MPLALRVRKVIPLIVVQSKTQAALVLQTTNVDISGHCFKPSQAKKVFLGKQESSLKQTTYLAQMIPHKIRIF